MKRKNNQICKHCQQLKSKHDDWVATGEFAEQAVCVTGEMDKEGRYLKLQFFEPMTNLEYLKGKYDEKPLS